MSSTKRRLRRLLNDLGDVLRPARRYAACACLDDRHAGPLPWRRRRAAAVRDRFAAPQLTHLVVRPWRLSLVLREDEL